MNNTPQDGKTRYADDATLAEMARLEREVERLAAALRISEQIRAEDTRAYLGDTHQTLDKLGRRLGINTPATETQIVSAIERLQGEVLNLRADKGRIDWLSDTSSVSWSMCSWATGHRSIELVCAEVGEKWPGCGRTFATAREAIDSAMRRTGK